MALNLRLERGLAEARFLQFTGPQGHPSMELLMVQLAARWSCSGPGIALPHLAARLGKRITTPREMGRVRTEECRFCNPLSCGG